MKELLNTFFSSTEFLKQFKIIRDQKTDYSHSIDYQLKAKLSRTILLRFYDYEGVMSVSVLRSGKKEVRMIYFRDIHELTFLFNRISAIRAADPLCSLPLLITALSLSQQND